MDITAEVYQIDEAGQSSAEYTGEEPPTAFARRYGGEIALFLIRSKAKKKHYHITLGSFECFFIKTSFFISFSL